MSKNKSENELSRDEIRLLTAKKFLKTSQNFKILYDLLENSRYGGMKVSIRTLEWFVVNYSESNDISYNLEEASSISSEMFQVNKSYQDQLRVYTKKSFDPFCRKGENNARKFKKIVRDGDTKVLLEMTTNLAQLNFFMWAIGNKVLDYIVDNYKEVMKCKKIAERQRRKAKGARKMLDTTSTETESIDSNADYDSDNTEKNIKKEVKPGSRRKRQGEVVVRHFRGGITFPLQ